MFHGGIHTLFQAFAVSFVNNKFIDDNFDEVIFVTVNPEIVFDFSDFIVNADMQKTFAANLLKQFAVMSFSPFYNGSKNKYPLSVKVILYELQNFLFSVFHHFFTGIIRESLCCTGIEESEK